MRSSILALALVGLTNFQVIAAPQTFDFKDPKGVNNATFKLDAPLETITGSANGISGTVTIDTDKPEASTGKIEIDAKSLHVENTTMKEHMHGKDWMDSANHGKITFSMESLSDVKRSGDVFEAKVKGKFTMKGVAKEITVPVKATLLPGKLAQRTNGRMQGDLLVLRSTFVVKRGDFGINPSGPADKVADEVEVSLAIAGACPKS